MSFPTRQNVTGLGQVLFKTATVNNGNSTASFDADGLKRIWVVGIENLFDPAADDVWGVHDDMNAGADGSINVPSDGIVQVQRAGSTGTKTVAVEMIGF